MQREILICSPAVLNRKEKHFLQPTASAQPAEGAAAGVRGGLQEESVVFPREPAGRRWPVLRGGVHLQAPNTYYEGSYFKINLRFPIDCLFPFLSKLWLQTSMRPGRVHLHFPPSRWPPEPEAALKSGGTPSRTSGLSCRASFPSSTNPALPITPSHTDVLKVEKEQKHQRGVHRNHPEADPRHHSRRRRCRVKVPLTLAQCCVQVNSLAPDQVWSFLWWLLRKARPSLRSGQTSSERRGWLQPRRGLTPIPQLKKPNKFYLTTPELVGLLGTSSPDAETTSRKVCNASFLGLFSFWSSFLFFILGFPPFQRGGASWCLRPVGLHLCWVQGKGPTRPGRPGALGDPSRPDPLLPLSGAKDMVSPARINSWSPLFSTLVCLESK